jgi:hypothetical protein
VVRRNCGHHDYLKPLEVTFFIEDMVLAVVPSVATPILVWYDRVAMDELCTVIYTLLGNCGHLVRRMLYIERCVGGLAVVSEGMLRLRYICPDLK